MRFRGHWPTTQLAMTTKPPTDGLRDGTAIPSRPLAGTVR
jgi:hypothetical protein